MTVLLVFLAGVVCAAIGAALIYNEVKHPGKNQRFFDQFRK